MSRLKFDIKYRSQIESGEYKLETESGNPAFVMDWDWNWDGEKCVAVKVPGLGRDNALLYHFNGERASIFPSEKSPALFIITPEQELTEFETALLGIINDAFDCIGYNDENAKIDAAKLLGLARKEFIKQGYVIEKKAFHDAVERIDDKHKAEMSVEYALYESATTRHAVMNWEEFQKVAQHFIDCGKAEALKDLPWWKVSRAMRSTMPTVMWGDNGMILYKDGFEISISDLENLPKENEK